MAAASGPPSASRAVVLCVGTGNIGAALVAQLRARGDVEVLECSRSSAALVLDLESPASLAALRERLPHGVDHVAVTAGESFDSAEKWERNLATKLGAVSSFVLRLVHGDGAPCLLRDGGSITITTGQSARTVNRMWPGLAVNNAGLDMFVRCVGWICRVGFG
ncbi:unnamed protein product [Prorocentrum cordatum]|uniref:Uncharacterized protein n=1 Tax=Prorocentrum cordatum TaxID=2364126 RepID=A0ABN9TFA6_9DINO|nr:unnamed protein product [Polarella glacialis]